MGGQIVTIEASVMETKQVARKIFLQARNNNEALKDKFRTRWSKLTGTECEFLDLETSLAIWDVALRSGVAGKGSYSLNTEEFEGEAADDVESISRRIEVIDSINGFCLTYFWRQTGAILTDLKTLTKNFNALMLLCEDEINFYSSDFKKALPIEGDRSGSGDRLNYLSVSVSGDWVNPWQESSK